MGRDKLLTIATDGEEVTISIGVSALSKALLPYSNVTITDESAFTRSIVYALMEEEEDGTTPVHRMFDDAAEWCAEQGLEGLEYPEEDPEPLPEPEPDLEPLWSVWLWEFNEQKCKTVVRAKDEQSAREAWCYIFEQDMSNRVVAAPDPMAHGPAAQLVRNWEVL